MDRECIMSALGDAVLVEYFFWSSWPVTNGKKIRQISVQRREAKQLAHRGGRTRSLEIARELKSLTLYPIELGRLTICLN